MSTKKQQTSAETKHRDASERTKFVRAVQSALSDVFTPYRPALEVRVRFDTCSALFKPCAMCRIHSPQSSRLPFNVSCPKMTATGRAFIPWSCPICCPHSILRGTMRIDQEVHNQSRWMMARLAQYLELPASHMTLALAMM